MSRFSISTQARQDLDDIWFYIASDNVKAADQMMGLLQSQFRLLVSQSMMGISQDDFAVGLRFFAVGDFLIFYRPEDDLSIYRVLQGSLPTDSGYFNE